MIHLLTKSYLTKIPLLAIKRGYQFSRVNPSSQNQKNQNYLKSRVHIKKVEEPSPEFQLQDTNLTDLKYMQYILMANIIMVGSIPFYPAANVGVCLLNGGFVLSQIGQEFKRFLILVNNKHYEQLQSYKEQHQYLKIILLNSLVFAGVAGMLAFKFYYFAHGLTILWFLLNFYFKTIPIAFYPILAANLLALLFNLFTDPVKQLLEQDQQKNVLQQ